MATESEMARHIAETKTLYTSPNIPNAKSNDITRDKEEELLYGDNDDGDEEDALSDDSMRLRLSDDEAEEQPAITRDTSNEKTKRDFTEMELESTDSSERKSALRGGNLSNGECTVESNLKIVEDAKEEVRRDLASDGNTKKEIFNNCPEKYRNDEKLNSPLVTEIGEATSKNWHYQGHFGHFSKHEKRNPVPRHHHTNNERYFMNRNNEKYYNKNTHYGGGKTCCRGYNLYNKRDSREMHVNFDESLNNQKYSSTIFSSKIANKELKNEKIRLEYDKCTDESRVHSSDSNNSCSNDAIAKSDEAIETRQSVIIEPEEKIKISGNNENADEAAIVSVNNQVDPVRSVKENREEEHKENPLLNCEIFSTSSICNPESNKNCVNDEIMDNNAVNEAEVSRLVVGSTNIEENSSDAKKSSSTEIISNCLEEEEKKNKEEKVVEKLSSNEMRNDIEQTVKSNDEKNYENVPMDETSECKNNANLRRETLDEECPTIINNEIAEKYKEKPSSSETNEVGSGEKDEAELIAKITENLGDNDECAVQLNEGKNLDELWTKTLESSNDVDTIDKTKEEAESPESSGVTSPETEKRLNIPYSEQAPQESSRVATEVRETIDNRKIAFADETSELKVSLTAEIVNKNVDTQSVDDNATSDDITDGNKATLLRCLLKRSSSEFLLDEMELSKRMRIGRKRSDDTSESSNSCNEIVSELVSNDDSVVGTSTNEKTDDKSFVDNSVYNNKVKSPDLKSDGSVTSDIVVEKSSSSRKSYEKKSAVSVTPNIDDDKVKIDDCEVIEVNVKHKQKRSRRSLNSLHDNVVSQAEDSQETENIRQKRKTAKNAEEIIRKEFLGNSDSESNDSVSKFVAVNYNKTNNNLRSASPPTLKRNYVDDEVKNESTTVKKLKPDVNIKSNGDISTKNESPDQAKKQILRHVRNFFRRDANGSLCKLKQEELEELLIQKVVETITMRDEIGKLREQAKLSERNQEATRNRCQQLSKQIKDFEMVLSRYKSDLRANPDSKTVVPIKINRSVGLQVNFLTDHGIQNLRQLQQIQKTALTPVANGSLVGHHQHQNQQQQQQNEQSTSASGVKRSLKVRSPRRPEPPATIPIIPAVTTPVHSPQTSTITPAALLVAKSITDSRPTLTPAVQQTTVTHPQLITSNQSIILNGNVTNQSIRQATALHVSKKSSDLIDLTQEEDKTKTTVVPQNSMLTSTINDTSPSVSNVQKIAPRFHTVIQAIPGSMAITAQSGIRVVQPSSQPTPTALVNNMNAPRLTYVTMQGGIVPRQVVITSTPTPIRPAPANNIRATFPISGTITNSTVRVIPTTGTTTLLYKHPASLPDPINPTSNPTWKLPPPAPSLKISKVANGIVLSWNMALSDKYAEIASYQLYAYQEVSGIAPNPSLWKKVGDVRALPLPMACTLTQFSEGNNYYFAVRAVDKHSRFGQYSQPGNISL